MNMAIETLSNLEGVIIPLITPYFKGNFDEESFLTVANNCVEAGVSGFFILGTTGEFQKLSVEQRKYITEFAINRYSGRTLIIVGTTGNTLEDTIELTKHAESHGANAAVIAPIINPTIKPHDYAEGILNATERIPIALYNNPTITRNEYIPYEVVVSLSTDPRIIGIKDSSANLDYFKRILDLRSNSFGVLQGNERVLQESLSLGIDGFVPGFGNIDPGLMVKIYRDQQKQDIQEMIRLRGSHHRTGVSAEIIKQWAYDRKLIRSNELAS